MSVPMRHRDVGYLTSVQTSNYYTEILSILTKASFRVNEHRGYLVCS